MFAPYFCQNLNREVRRSSTWHSSESESARGRFEPVAVVKDTAGRSGVLCSHWSPRGDGRRFLRGGELTHTRSVCVGVAETGGKALLNDFCR